MNDYYIHAPFFLGALEYPAHCRRVVSHPIPIPKHALGVVAPISRHAVRERRNVFQMTNLANGSRFLSCFHSKSH